ncbi:hypothetical protein PGTUg99_014784 [Puccinia graminis f. sp. tritici]|uniref:Uncharacterized protein n=1 Tax=Puccinia graminis f. sp. tritici TaxID=56615 RepID=A0A5B0RXT5_PUCGR|nr:hypothetical protein PGTUg99_014784 [Puccinia graminis f. sp. tritici]
MTSRNKPRCQWDLGIEMLNIGPRKYASYQLTNQTIRSPYWSAQNRMMEIIKENEQARKLYGKLSQPSGGPSS